MFAYIPDILLILISSLACLYCFLLSRRLKKLQNLNTGLGASIVSLTEVIAETSTAAGQARKATQQSVELLQTLLNEAENSIPQVEARIESLRHSKNAAKAAHTELKTLLVSEIQPELKNARLASTALLKIVREVSDFQSRNNQANTVRPERAA